MARGTARLFGIRIPRNFQTPYLSRSPGEFWQRWHISLSSWLRDYLYIPLGGNRFGTFNTLRNLLLTMFLAGLWHGASVFYILWGLYHGALLILYRLYPLHEILPRHFGRMTGNVLAWLLMFVFTVIGWMFFLSATHHKFIGMAKSAAQAFYYPWDPHMLSYGWGLALFTLPLIATDMIGYRASREFVDVYPHYSFRVKTILYIALFYAIVFFAARDSHDFIYFKF